MNDSRHDIERDAGELVADYARNGSVCDELYHGILGLLDRQAALTERETSHDNPYVGLVRGKQWERTEMSDYYCGRCGWKVTDHDSYCPECGGALHRASNEPDSQFDVPKTAETPETDAAKGDMRDFDDTREKIESEIHNILHCISITAKGKLEKGTFEFGFVDGYEPMLHELLDRQAALTEREVEHDLMKAGRMAVEVERERIAELQAKVDELNDKLTTALNNQKNLEDRLWEYDGTHMLLPVDADGVPIHVGDKMEYADGTKFEVDGIGSGGTLFSVDDGSNSAWWTNAEDKRHVSERTVESVLGEFASRVLNSGHQWGLDAPEVVPEYAAELRELMGVDDD